MSNTDIAATARTLLERSIDLKVTAVAAAATAAAAAEEAAAAAKDADAAHEKAWKAALTAGWSERELADIGVRGPGRPAPRRTTKKTTTTTAAGAASAAFPAESTGGEGTDL